MRVVFLAASLLWLWGLDAQACINSSVRDGAFLEPRDIHRLCAVLEPDDSVGRGIYERLRDWFQDSGKDLNIEFLRVVADDPTVRWSDYGVPSAPPALPVVVLAGWHPAERRSFFIDYWEPGPSIEDLEILKESPVRQAIRCELVRKLAVLLYVRGTDSDADSAEKVLDSVVDTWSKKEPLGVSVVILDRSDERERGLLSFMGVERTGPDWVGVMFGRGKLMPPLQGTEITEAQLSELIQFLVGECTCLRPPSSFGVDIPMVWEETLDSAIVPLRVIDNPIGLAWNPPAITEAGSSPFGRRIFTTALWTLGVLVFAVTLATIVILWRRNRGDAAPLLD
jgi:hypothetical protein